MKKRKTLKLFTFIMALAVLVMSLPIYAFSVDIDGDNRTIQNGPATDISSGDLQADLADAEVLWEIENLRKEADRRFCSAIQQHITEQR